MCGEPGAKSAVGNEQLRLLWSEDRQMMLFFSFAVAWLQFYWTKLLESAFGIFLWSENLRRKGCHSMSFANLNLMGRLVGDPEFKTGKENREFCTFSVAVNQQFGAQENTSFYNCTGNELIARRVRNAGLCKGRMIHISGNLTLREYKTQGGETRMSADVGILDWHFVGSKPKSEEQQGQTPANHSSNKPGKVHQEQYIGDDDDELPI